MFLIQSTILPSKQLKLSFAALFFKARMVAAATSNLCEAANASVQGHASEEKLISSAKQVAASTAQLLVACKVKADQDSEAMRRLQVRTCSTWESMDGSAAAAVTCYNTVLSTSRGFKFDFKVIWSHPLTDCWECSEEGIRQLGAGSSECCVQQSRRWQRGG